MAMQRTMKRTMKSRYLDEVARRVLVYDGAMGTQIQNLGLSAADYGGEAYDGCPKILVVSRPDAIREIHRAYLAAGADVLETDTFTGTRLKLDDYHLGARTHEINRAAAALARAAADEFSTSERPRFVAGSMGPTGMLPSADDPALSQYHLPAARRAVSRAGRGPSGGRGRSALDRDQPGHPRSARRHHRHPAGVGGGRTHRADSGAGDARHQRAHAAGHGRRRGRRHPHQLARGPRSASTARPARSTCASRCAG